MQIQVNGQPREIDDDLTLAALIATLVEEGSRYAVEINEELIPHSEHPEHLLREGDRVEIVQAIGGG